MFSIFFVHSRFVSFPPKFLYPNFSLNIKQLFPNLTACRTQPARNIKNPCFELQNHFCAWNVVFKLPEQFLHFPSKFLSSKHCFWLENVAFCFKNRPDRLETSSFTRKSISHRETTSTKTVGLEAHKLHPRAPRASFYSVYHCSGRRQNWQCGGSGRVQNW